MLAMPGTITRSPEILSGASDLRDAYNIELQSASGNPVRFGDLILEKGEITTVIIFSAFGSLSLYFLPPS